MRLLVTGGAGFIGSNFVDYVLTETEHSVITIDALTYAGSEENVDQWFGHPRYTFVEGDVRDGDLVDRLTSQVDAVVNFAAESHVDRAVESAKPFASTNVVGTQTLLESAAAHGVERFVQISTDEVYGDIQEGKFSESDALNPRNPYAATKAGAGLLAHSYYVSKDLPVVITRSSNNYGPRQHPEKFIPKLLTRTMNGERFPLYGDGSHVRDWLYVEDNCRAIELLLREGEPGEAYNVAAGNELTNLEVIDAVADMTRATRDLVEFVDDRPAHDQRYALTTDKIRSLGWEPRWEFTEGLERTIEYYR